MNCSVKFLVPMVMVGAPGGAPPLFDDLELPPQPASATMRTAMAAVRSRVLISGDWRLVARGWALRDLRRGRNLEMKRAALTGFALGPDPPAVVLDDAL